MSAISTEKIYFKNLDGLRFLCFLSVFLYHSFYTNIASLRDSSLMHIVKHELFGNGNLGVNVFFVLSGFLITYFLIIEKLDTGKIDVKKFWIRRVLRIWPLFYLAILFGFLVFPLIKAYFGEVPDEHATLWKHLLFLNNFDYINTEADASSLNVLWSVAIEEQFYLVWPLIFYFTRVKRLWIPFLTIIVVNLTFRYLNNDPVLYEYHTLSCIGDMVIGAFGAWLIISFRWFRQFVIDLNGFLSGLIYGLFVTVFFFRDDIIHKYPSISVYERLIIAIIILGIILVQSFAKKTLIPLAKIPFFANLGQLTYGMYILFSVAILVALKTTDLLHLNTSIWEVIILETLISLSITIVLAWLSKRYFESFFLKLKRKFEV